MASTGAHTRELDEQHARKIRIGIGPIVLLTMLALAGLAAFSSVSTSTGGTEARKHYDQLERQLATVNIVLSSATENTSVLSSTTENNITARVIRIGARVAWCWIMVCAQVDAHSDLLSPLSPFCRLPSVEHVINEHRRIHEHDDIYKPIPASPRFWMDMYNYVRPDVPALARPNVCGGPMNLNFLTDAGTAAVAARAHSDLNHCAALMMKKHKVDVGTPATIRTVRNRGPGGCGGNPYVATASGTFAHCAEECQRNVDCIKFQRETSSGSCYLSGENSAIQSLEPSGEAGSGWECGFIEMAKPDAWSTWKACTACSVGNRAVEGVGGHRALELCTQFCSKSGQCGSSGAHHHVDCTPLSTSSTAQADSQLWSEKGCAEWMSVHGATNTKPAPAILPGPYTTGYEENSPRATIQEMTEKDLQAFPFSKVRIDTFEPGYTVKMSHVCLSSRDGWLVPLPKNTALGRNGTGLGKLFDPTTFQHMKGHTWLSGPDIPRAVKYEDFVQFKKVKFVRGESAAVNCYRCHYGCANPAHYLFGYTRLFGGKLLRDVPKLSSIAFHQCPPRRLFSLGTLFWKYVARRLSETDRWYGENATNLITIAANLDGGWSEGPSKMPQPSDDITCFEHLHGDLWHTGSYLTDPNDRHVWKAYSREASQAIHRHGGVPVMWSTQPTTNIAAPLTRPRPPLNYTVHKRVKDGKLEPLECSHTCTDELRIGVWHRLEGNHLRRFTNEADIVAMLQKYTRLPVKLYTLNSHTPAEEQMIKFAEFDLMVTTHGSQMSNVVFAQENATVVEVMAVPFDQSICGNGRPWTKLWIQSHGHTPAQNGKPLEHLASVIHSQAHGLASSATADEKDLSYSGYKNIDLIVNLERLKEDVELAIAKRCDCPGIHVETYCAPKDWSKFPWKATSG